MIVKKTAVALGILSLSLAVAPMALAEGEDGIASELRLEGPNGPVAFVVDDSASMRSRLEEGYVLLNDINCGLAPETRNAATGVCAATINACDDFDPVGWTAYFEGLSYDVDIHAVDGGSDEDSEKSWAMLVPVLINGAESGFFLDLDKHNLRAVEATLADYASRESVSLGDFLRVLEMDANGESAGWPVINIAEGEWPTGLVEVTVYGRTFKVRFTEGSSDVVPDPASDGADVVPADGENAPRPDSGQDAEPAPADASVPAAADTAAVAAAAPADVVSVHVKGASEPVEPSVSGASTASKRSGANKASVPAADKSAKKSAVKDGDTGLEKMPQFAGTIREAKAAPKLPVTGLSRISFAQSDEAGPAASSSGMGLEFAAGLAALVGGACFLLMRRA